MPTPTATYDGIHHGTPYSDVARGEPAPSDEPLTARLERILHQVGDGMQARPILSIALGLGAGYLVGRLMDR